MLTRRELLDDAIDRLHAAGVEDARRNAEWILEEAAGVSRATLIGHPEVHVSDDERTRFEAMLTRRLKREPLQYVVGHTEFFGLRIRVSPAVLIPRPETEELVEAALERIRQRRAPWVLDIGTGSGAIALALKRARPDAEVFACDLSEKALNVAAENADRLGLAITLIHADALAPAFADGVPACFDLIVSNPPYISVDEQGELMAEVVNFEPHEALFSSDDPLKFYRAIAGHAERLLRKGGDVFVEIHAERAREVIDTLQAAGLRDVSLRKDMAGRDRIVSGHRPSG